MVDLDLVISCQEHIPLKYGLFGYMVWIFYDYKAIVFTKAQQVSQGKTVAGTEGLPIGGDCFAHSLPERSVVASFPTEKAKDPRCRVNSVGLTDPMRLIVDGHGKK